MNWLLFLGECWRLLVGECCNIYVYCQRAEASPKNDHHNQSQNHHTNSQRVSRARHVHDERGFASLAKNVVYVRHKHLLMLHTWGVSSFLCYQNCWKTAMLTKIELCVLRCVWMCFERRGKHELCVFRVFLMFFERRGKLEHTFSAYISFCVEALATLSAL